MRNDSTRGRFFIFLIPKIKTTVRATTQPIITHVKMVLGEFFSTVCSPLHQINHKNHSSDGCIFVRTHVNFYQDRNIFS
jgi:hypothetical protein